MSSGDSNPPRFDGSIYHEKFEGDGDTYVQLAESSQLAAIAEIGCAAFMDDPLYSWLHPHRKTFPQDFYDWKDRITCALFYSGIARFYVLMHLEEDSQNKKRLLKPIGYVMMQRFYGEGWLEKLDKKSAKRSQWREGGWTYCEYLLVRKFRVLTSGRSSGRGLFMNKFSLELEEPASLLELTDVL